MERSGRTTRQIEWPTVWMFAGCYSAWAITTVFHQQLGLLIIPLLGVIGALHLSLQHEALHGHPTGNRRINELLAGVPLTLLVPYRRYKVLHLAHHNDERITDPILDPESFYMEPERWAELPRALRLLYRFNNTLIGRLLLGPGIWAVTFIAGELRILARSGPESRSARTAWGVHALFAGAVVVWILYVAGMPLWLYLVSAVYPAFMLTMLRTFAEHQAVAEPARRSVIVDRAPLLSVLFLNNNLHYLHHKHPTIAWYRLPALFRAERDRLLKENGGYRFASYFDILKAYAFRPKEPVPHPLANAAKSGPAAS